MLTPITQSAIYESKSAVHHTFLFKTFRIESLTVHVLQIQKKYLYFNIPRNSHEKITWIVIEVPSYTEHFDNM